MSDTTEVEYDDDTFDWDALANDINDAGGFTQYIMIEMAKKLDGKEQNHIGMCAAAEALISDNLLRSGVPLQIVERQIEREHSYEFSFDPMEGLIVRLKFDDAEEVTDGISITFKSGAE